MRQVGGWLFSFYDWCAQNEQVTELTTLAGTVSRWEDEIATAVLTGVTNAAGESLSRLAKLEARMAYGFRNPASQRRRVRTACTRGTRRKRGRVRPITSSNQMKVYLGYWRECPAAASLAPMLAALGATAGEHYSRN